MRRFLGLLLLALPLATVAKTPLLAVGDLSPRGVSRNDAAIISDRLREALVQSDQVRVLEREEMDRILKEQAFQQSGACDQSECAVKIGKLLSVDRMVVGTVGRIGELYTISARILDVGTGEVLFTASRDESGSLEDLLTRAVPDLGSKLAQGALVAARNRSSTEGHGDLQVTISDTLAAFFLNGKAVQGRSPFLFEGLPTGAYHLEARTPTHKGTAMVELSPDDVLKFELFLDWATTSAKLYSQPTGAQVYHREKDVEIWKGETPLRIDSLPVGRHRFLLRRPGSLDTTIEILAEQGKIASHRVKLIPAGTVVFDPPPNVQVRFLRGRDTIEQVVTHGIQLPEGLWRIELENRAWERLHQELRIRSGKEDTIRPVSRFVSLRVNASVPAEVWIDGDSVGAAPFRSDTLAPGIHAVLVRAPGKADWTHSIELRQGDEVAVKANLEDRHAWLNLSSKIQGKIELDGVDLGVMAPERSPGENRSAILPESGSIQGQIYPPSSPPRRFLWRSDTLLPGRHRVRVTADRRIPWESDIALVAGLQVTHEVSLPWTEEELARQRRTARLGLRIGTGVLAATFLGAATWYGTNWSESVARADRIQDEYDRATTGFSEIRARHDRARGDAQDARGMTVTMGLVGALMASGFALTWVF